MYIIIDMIHTNVSTGVCICMCARIKHNLPEAVISLARTLTLKSTECGLVSTSTG